MDRFVISAVVLVFWGIATSAQELITLKIKERGEGDSTSVQRKSVSSLKIKSKPPFSTGVDLTVTQLEERTETVLKQSKDKAEFKLRRQYHRIKIASNGDDEKVPLAGKIVIIEKHKKGYRFSLEGGDAIPESAQEELEDEFNAKADALGDVEGVFFPKHAVKVGDRWTFDLPLIAKAWDLEIDAEKAIGSVTLVRVYDKDGRRFGELKIKFEMPVRSNGSGDTQVRFSRPATFRAEGSYDVCIDGTTDSRTLKMKGTLEGTGAFSDRPFAPFVYHRTLESTDAYQEIAKKK